jgi:lipopolysaccharide transport system ATP-binding protein
MKSMTDVAICVDNLSKLYRIGPPERYKTLRDTLTDTVCAPFRRLRSTLQRSNPERANDDNTIWALKDVSFEVTQGEVLGIIGRNGAGKTTLLKILSRITEPTEGRAEIYGRVGSLLEVGTGFHPELTGRENIYLNGAILGMKRAEIERKFDEIVAFAGIEKFLDTPVKHYSSGMYVRLAFAVAAHLDPEILLVDEVLAVGDAEFQKKCLGKMGDVARGGRTVLLVSHNMGAVSRLCERALWLDSGRIVEMGPTYEVIQDYLDISASATGTWVNPSTYETEPEIKLLSASITNGEGVQAGSVRFDESFGLEIYYEVVIPGRSWSLVFRVSDSSGTPVFTSWDTDSGSSGKPAEAGRFRAICHVPAKLLRPGTYSVTLGTYAPHARMFDIHEHLFHFEVSALGYAMNVNRWGIITPVLEWSIERSSN